ncbi:hypothetical protein [Actinomadura sp. SCN-SB]|uniref:hypothetical protein n=1 Tax=Actinomadura sp. SCN-SB TaxID=3373092 RepID=UPI0037509EE0
MASAFRLLTTGPGPLCLDGTEIGHGLPRRSIPLNELRAILLHPATGRAARDAAWRHLLSRARSGEPAWVIGAVGVALPALRQVVAGLAEGHRGQPEEVPAAALAAFVEAVHRIDADRPGVITRLRWAAYRAALAARYHRDGLPTVPLPVTVSAAPPPPWGHPDLVLADAVVQGVLSSLQAELIGRSRLEDLTLKQAAAELGVDYQAACKARQRGEARLVAAISSGKVAQRVSAAAPQSGLSLVRAPHAQPGSPPDSRSGSRSGNRSGSRAGAEPADVRGQSTSSGGTPEPDTNTNAKGVFCGPAHQPPTPSRDSTPANSADSTSDSTSGGTRRRSARRRRRTPGTRGRSATVDGGS